MELLNWVQENWIVLFTIVTTVVTFASLVASLTPSPKDDEFWAKVVKIVDSLALNVKHATPARSVVQQAPEAESVSKPREPAQP